MSKNAERLCGAEGGFALVAERKLVPLLPEDQRYRDLIRTLLINRENIQSSSARNEALGILWELAYTAARFGAEIDIKKGFSVFKFPPIPSRRLVELEIITDGETIRQVEMRKKTRKKRGKGVPENRVSVKAAEEKELQALKLENLGKPVLIIEERYTVTLSKDPSVELDRIGRFALYQDKNGVVQLLFLGETQEPHAHAFAAGQWWRIDRQTHHDFKIPEDIPLPQPAVAGSPVPATQDQIATLLVLVVEGVKSPHHLHYWHTNKGE